MIGSSLSRSPMITGALLFGAALMIGQFAGSGYLVNLLIITFLHAIPAIGLALLVGYTGQISIGQAAFYGLGAYCSALLTIHLGINPWLSIAAAMVVVSALAYGIGWIIFRVRGHHLAIATLGFGIIVSIGFTEMRWLTGGANGLVGIPPLAIGDFVLNSDSRFFFVAWAGCLLTYIAAINLVRSPIGLLMRGVAESERAASSLGTDVAAFKRKIFMLSAAIAAFSGGLYGHYIGFISPQPFGTGFSIQLLLIVAVGGFLTIPGVVLGTAFITAITQLLQQFGHFDVVIFGILLILVVTAFPHGLFVGLIDLTQRLVQLLGRRKALADQ